MPLIHPIGVMEDKFQEGISELSDQVPPLTISPFVDAFKKRWEDDAHFVTYFPINNDSQPHWPRITKPALSKLQAVGVDLQTELLVLDYDNPGHGKWTPEMLTVFLNQLQELAVSWPTAWEWTLLYTTRNGARLVYVLDQPISVELSERKHQWLCQEFTKKGIPIDQDVSDWTRCFRLPNVVRDRKKTWEETNPPMQMYWQYDNCILLNSIGEAEPRKGATANVYGKINTYDTPKPTYDDAVALLYARSESGALGHTRWLTTAKKRLEGRECFDCIFKHAPIAEQGQRNPTIARYVGQATAMMYPVQGTTPLHIYGLFIDAVQQLEPDASTPDWTHVLWSLVLRMWAREEAKKSGQQDLTPEESEKKALSLIDSIILGMMEWCDEPILHSLHETSTLEDKQKVINWVMRRIIISVGTSYFIMGSNGWYDSLELNSKQLVSNWRIKGFDVLLNTSIPKDNGKGLRDISPEVLINTCATIVNEVRAVPCLKGSYVENIDTAKSALIRSCYSRNVELEATSEWNADVDEWLRHLGGENYPQLVTWIQWALAFEEGKICALSIEGTQGLGKGLLVQGLAECMTVPKFATAMDLVSPYQYGLLESPFLVVNEGWPKIQNGLHPADQFRHIVGGDPIVANRRYMAPTHLRNPVRVIFTANNSNVVQELTGSRDLSPDDREALAIRLLHMKLSPDASLFLRMRGGMSFTGKPGNRWITGDAGQKSDFILARHFLWLYQNRGTPPGARERFLVEGGKSVEMMFEMRTHSGSAPLVIQILLKMLECPQLPKGITIENHQIFVLTSEILTFFRKEMSNVIREKLTSAQVTSVLKGLVADNTSDKPRLLETRRELGRMRWHELDVKLLVSVAQRDGWPSKVLDNIYAKLLQFEATNEKFPGVLETVTDMTAERHPVKPIHDLSIPKFDFGRLK